MEQPVIERAGAPQGSPAYLTWRDAVMPHAQSSRRRWVAIGAVLLLIVGVVAHFGGQLGVRSGDDSSVSGTAFVSLLIVFGTLRLATDGLAALDHPELDERDLGARNAAFRVAYPLLLLIIGVSFVVVVLTLPEASYRSAGIVQEARGLTADTILGMVLWAGLWAVFLPMAALAWREPDRPDPEVLDPADHAGAAEPLRDAIVALTFAVAIALDLAPTPSGWGLVAIVIGLTVLAGWKRWTVGQQAVGRGLWGIGIFFSIVSAASLVIEVLDGSLDRAFVITSGVTLVVGLVLLFLGRERPVRG